MITNKNMNLNDKIMKTMKKTGLLLILIGILFGAPCAAQEGYTVSGRLNGVSADRVCMVTADFGRADTLASAAVSGGNFVLTGIVPGDVRMVNLVFDGLESRVPLMLENTMYQMQITADGAAVNGGGEATRLYSEFNKVAQEYAAEQASVMTEYEKNTGNADVLQNRLDAAYKASVAKTIDLIKANPDNYVSAYVVASGIRSDSEELLRQKHALLGEHARATVPGKALEVALTRYDDLAVGKPAPDFTVKRPNGDDLTLSAVPAKLKLLVFWASWDAASRQANPQLIALYQQFRPKGLKIVSVSLDDNRFAWDRAIEQDGISIWPNGSDLKGMASPIAEAYMVGGVLPYTVLIDAEGNIAARGLLGAELRKTISDLTKKNKKING